MAKRSRIRTLPQDQRTFVEKLLREDTHTLDEMMALIRAEFPGEPVTSRSGLGRYKQDLDEMTSRMREIEHAAQVMVSELGDGVGDRAGALLAQAVTTLATHAALKAHDEDGISIKDIAALARAARNALEARTMSLKERQAVEEAARAKLVRQQAATLTKMTKEKGLSTEMANDLRKQLLGLD